MSPIQLTAVAIINWPFQEIWHPKIRKQKITIKDCESLGLGSKPGIEEQTQSFWVTKCLLGNGDNQASNLMYTEKQDNVRLMKRIFKLNVNTFLYKKKKKPEVGLGECGDKKEGHYTFILSQL